MQLLAPAALLGLSRAVPQPQAKAQAAHSQLLQLAAQQQCQLLQQQRRRARTEAQA